MDDVRIAEADARPIRRDQPRAARMGISYQYDMRKGYLHFEVTGEFTLDEACRTFAEALTIVDRLAATKVLIDCLGLQGAPTAMDHYRYGEFIAAELMRGSDKRKQNPQLAYVTRQPLRDKRDLSATVATNRGVFMKSVDTVEEGLEWLGVDSGGR